MNPLQEHGLLLTRRHFFGRMATGIGAAALGSLLNPRLFAALVLITAAGVALFGVTLAVSRFALARWHESELELAD